MTATPIKFGDNTVRHGTTAVDHAAQVWGTKITLPKNYTDTAKKLGRWREVVTKSHDALLVDVLDQADPKDWGDLILDKAQGEAARTVVQANDAEFTRRLQRRAALLFNAPETYEHIVRQLDVDTVEGEFIDAARTLGDKYKDIEEAVKHDAVATATYMQAGLKLKALAAIPGSATTYDSQPAPRPGNLVVLCAIETLPELRRTVSYRTTLERHYGDADEHPHAQANKAKELQHHVGELLTQTALGAFPGVSVSVARTAKELRQRQETVASIYRFTDTHVEGNGGKVGLMR